MPAAVAPVLTFDTTGTAVFATNRETGVRVRLFEDEAGETEDEGTWHELLSSFGPYVSYQMTWYYEGGAHPTYGLRYTAAAVRDSLRDVEITDLFSEAAILESLRQDSLIRATDLGAVDPDTARLDEIIEALGEAYPCRIYAQDFYSGFFVRAVDGDTAVVEVGLSYGCEAQRGTFTVIPLRLPIDETRRPLFNDLRVFRPGWQDE